MKCTGLLLMMLPLMLLSACGEQEDIVVYEVRPVARYDWPNLAAREAEHEGMVWDIPAGWVATEDLADTLVADYRFKGTTEDLPGRLTVSMIPGDGGGLAANINRWRSQFFIDVMRRERIPLRERISPALPFGPGTLHFVEMEGDYINRHAPTTMVTAIFTFLDQSGRPFQTWFFKLTGDQATVERARDDFSQVIVTFRRTGEPKPDLSELDQINRGPSPAPSPDRSTGDQPPPALRRPAGATP